MPKKSHINEYSDFGKIQEKYSIDMKWNEISIGQVFIKPKENGG